MLISKKFTFIIFFAILSTLIGFTVYRNINKAQEMINKKEVLAVSNEKRPNWLILHRKSNTEFLYQGVPGDKKQSKLIKTFTVKVGIPSQRPTPLPQLLGREYWLITEKAASEDPETAPYFLTLDVPTGDEWPYGPTPYLECNGQCDWVTIGYFGLHGVNGKIDKLSKEDPGSSGCIRHSDEDIVYLYNLLEPEKEEIRYYIEDV